MNSSTQAPSAGDADHSAYYACELEAALHHHGVGIVVTGWLQLPATTERFRSVVLIGGRPVVGAFRYRERPDLPSGPAIRSLGFEFHPLPEELPRLLDAPVVLVVGDGRGGVRAERWLEVPRWAWEFEILGDRVITGWVVDLIRPDLPAVLLARTGTTVQAAVAGALRTDVVLSPGVVARSFTLNLGGLDDLEKSDRPGGGAEISIGDLLNPVLSLPPALSVGRAAAVALLSARRAEEHRAILSGLLDIEAKFTRVESAPRSVLARGFEAVGRGPSLAIAGFARRAGPSDAGRGMPVRWGAADSGAPANAAIVAATGLSLAPTLGERVRQLAGRDGRVPDAWFVANGIHDLGARPTRDSEAFPFLKPRLTRRLLAQTVGIAPLVVAPETALDRWNPADGLAVLHEQLWERLGPPEPLHEVLYAAPGRPKVVPDDTTLATARKPMVSMVVPSRDNVAYLAKLLASVARLRRRYDNLEVVIVDNDSRQDATAAFLGWAAADWLHIVRDRGGFNFARLSNLGARRARGTVLLFCNDDVEIGADFDVARLLAPLGEPGVGIVGHTLIYEDGAIQHGGIVVGAYDAADNGQTAFAIADGGYFGLAALTREVTAVTGAFLAVRNAVFRKLGGFDELNFGVSFNDVDLCLRAGRAGLAVLNAYCGTVVHWESVSRARSPDHQARELAEVGALRRIWRTTSFEDPYYSPGFDRHALPYTRPARSRIGIDC